MQAKTENEILEDAVNKAVENGLITTDSDIINKIRNGERTENQYILDLSTGAYIWSQLWSLISDAYSSLDISTATGQSLDNWGLYVNVPRSMGEPARVQFDVSLQVSSANDLLIPQGTKVITNEQEGPFKEYIVSEDTIIPSGTLTTTIIAECQDVGYTRPLQPNSVQSIEGFPQLSISQPDAGTNGSNIESDDDYRMRLLSWQAATEKGSYDCINNYLQNYSGVSSFALVPMFEGVGTLKIVADTTNDKVSQLADDVYTYCVRQGDYKPVVVLPSTVQCPSITYQIKVNPYVDISLDQLEGLIRAQIDIFISGGTDRLGSPVAGFGVGVNFEPSNIIRYLMSNFPEIDNIILSSLDTVVVDATNKLVPGEVVIEWME